MDQAWDFLRGEDIHVAMRYDGTRPAAIYDYVYRSDDPENEELHFWEFMRIQEKYDKQKLFGKVWNVVCYK